MNKQITLRLPCKVYEALSDISKETGISVAHLVIFSILEYPDQEVMDK